jgi:2-methylcitrate dehydratase PrpD
MSVTARQPSLELAEYCVGLRYEELPDDVRLGIKALLLDHITCGLYGAALPWTRAAATALAGAACPGGAPLYRGGRRVRPFDAAFVNGTAAHGFELDDAFTAGSVHIGSAVIPAALSVAVADLSDGVSFLDAVLAGYEAVGRVSLATGGWHAGHGFHTTGTHGVLGSATAVARLRKLDMSRLVSSWGVAASMGSGLKTFVAGGGMVKRIHSALAAAHGVLAVDLVQAGLEGPQDGLAGHLGFLEVFGGPSLDRDRLTAGLGRAFVVSDVYIKPFAACAVTHPAVIAAIRLRRRAGGEYPDWIRVGTSRWGASANSIKAPPDIVSLQYSIEFSTVLGYLGLLDDPIRGMEHAACDEVRNLVSRTEVSEDASAQAVYPRQMAATVSMGYADGRVLTESVPSATEAVRAMPQWQQAHDKFLRLTSSILSAARQAAIISEVESLEDRPDLERLAGLLESP